MGGGRVSLAGKVKTTTAVKPAKKNALVKAEAPAESVSDELADLRKKSQEAVLVKPIQDKELKQYKIEQEKLSLEFAAGNIMTYEMGNYLFFGFFKKASRDWQRVGKRNKPILKNLVQEGDLDGVIKLYDEEITTIIKGLKREQKKVVDAWKRELKG